MKWWQRGGAKDARAPLYDAYGRMTSRHERWWHTKWWRQQRPFRIGTTPRRPRRLFRRRKPGAGLGASGSTHSLQWQREQYIDQMHGRGGWVVKVPPPGDSTPL